MECASAAIGTATVRNDPGTPGAKVSGFLATTNYLGYNLAHSGRIAQLVRALLSHSRGRGFESLCAHLNHHIFDGFLFSMGSSAARSARSQPYSGLVAPLKEA